MLKHHLLKVCFILLFPIALSAQTDTVYFNADWSKSSRLVHDYYRVITVSDSVISIHDFYKNGVKQMEGRIGNTEEGHETAKKGETIDQFAIGVFEYFNQDGSIYLSIDHDPDYKNMLDSAKIVSVNTDSLTYEITFYSNGNINQEGLFTGDGKHHGKITKRLKNGNIISIIEYDNGVLDGESTYYYPNGPMLSSAQYRQGVKHGKKIKYAQNGDVKSSKHFVNGELQKASKE